jgi:hypothetical protein
MSDLIGPSLSRAGLQARRGMLSHSHDTVRSETRIKPRPLLVGEIHSQLATRSLTRRSPPQRPRIVSPQGCGSSLDLGTGPDPSRWRALGFSSICLRGCLRKLFDPDYNVRRISLRRRYKGNPWFKRGTLFRHAIDVLRKAKEFFVLLSRWGPLGCSRL